MDGEQPSPPALLAARTRRLVAVELEQTTAEPTRICCDTCDYAIEIPAIPGIDWGEPTVDIVHNDDGTHGIAQR